MNDTCSAPDCGNLRPQHQFVCVNCVHLLKQDLDAATWLLTDLDTTISRQDAIVPPGARGRSAETALPFKWAASEALWVLGNVVTTWARLIVESSGYRPADDHTALGAVRFLRAHADVLCLRDDAGDAIAELEAAVKDALRAVDHPTDVRIYLGKCGDITGQRGCPGRVYALPAKEHGQCERCGEQHLTRERRALMLRAMANQHLTAQEISTMLAAVGVQVSVDQIQNGGRKRRFTAVGKDPHGKRSYRVGDVLREFLGPDWLAA
ncbi:hypothetical protein [Prauserella endophytica]|uniref:PhnA protein n=1 Tax=Prauserella endophytica TaxID=1592324 RepID=A0ABY2RSS8_9PSEU|nr:hypothetical protein [Prauserella endophytica]TKG58878.1 hypothetical protein FCN18_37315 [Prauserella endophytica]